MFRNIRIRLNNGAKWAAAGGTKLGAVISGALTTHAYLIHLDPESYNNTIKRQTSTLSADSTSCGFQSSWFPSTIRGNVKCIQTNIDDDNNTHISRNDGLEHTIIATTEKLHFQSDTETRQNLLNYVVTFAAPIGMAVGMGIGFLYGVTREVVLPNPEEFPPLEEIPLPAILEAEDPPLSPANNEVKEQEKPSINAQRLTTLGISSLNLPTEMVDPVTYEILENPTCLPCGHTCEMSTAMKLNSKCSLCNHPYDKKDLRPNYALKGFIENELKDLEDYIAGKNIAKNNQLETHVSESKEESKTETNTSSMRFFGKHIRRRQKVNEPTITTTPKLSYSSD